MAPRAASRSRPSGPAPRLVSDFLAGRVQLHFAAGDPLASMIRAGKIKAFASTGVTRDPVLPNVPTMAEAGLPTMTVNPSDWTGLLAPAGTPAAVIRKINEGYNRALSSPDVRDRLAAIGIDALGGTPEKFATFLKSEMSKWAKIAKDANIRVD